MSCPCDVRIFPLPLQIAAGLSDLPRQIAGFPEFREAMLAMIPQKPALAGWRARGDADFGVMLLEMWAYVCDVISFYDRAIAEESYVRTAKLRPSVRKLVSLLGYIPTPAVASAVRLALLADGKQPISIPVGTAFRSTAFGTEPPQVFEVDTAATIHPAANKWNVAPPPRPMLNGGLAYLLIQPGKSAIKDGDRIFVDCGASAGRFLRKAAGTLRFTDTGNKTWVRVDLDVPIALAAAADVSTIKIYKATRTAQLRRPVVSSETDPLKIWSTSHTDITLDGLYPSIKTGQRVFLSVGDDYRCFTVGWHDDEQFTIAQPPSFTDSGGGHVTPPAIKGTFTTIHVYEDINAGATQTWSSSTGPEMSVHFNLVEAGVVGNPDSLTLADRDPVTLLKVVAPSSGPPPGNEFFLVDGETRGVEIGGALDWTNGALTADDGTEWTPPLVLPVKAYGNVVSATRGQTVSNEALGTGNGSILNQSFELAKKPLTYVSSPTADNESGVASALAIWVGGIRWTEVPTFFGQDPGAQVFIVRHKDDGTAVVTFGDGTNGAVLPTGASVVATYRFGAGAACPPAGSITQLAKPVKGLKRVVNPVAAAGGAEADGADKIRTLAPKSALLLGRAISIEDMQAAAAAVPGVISATAEWRWDATRQRPVAQIWYIGAAGLEITVSQRLRAISDPSTPINVAVATPIRPALAIDVETDPRYIPSDVATAVSTALLDPDTGMLANERIGVSKPLFRSVLFEAVLAVPGAAGVRSLQWNETVFWTYAKKPPAGSYFDFEAGNLVVTGSAS